MTDGLRQEVGPHGIRVCVVAPGPTRTGTLAGCTKKTARVFNPGVRSLACVWRSLFLLFDGVVSGFASSVSEPILSLNS
jgi:NAD(P)-dependent dehydrogenase (short-subunit alcohol dehydrogenase family)